MVVWFFRIIIVVISSLLLVEGIGHLSIAIQGKDSWAYALIPQERKTSEIVSWREVGMGVVAVALAGLGVVALIRPGSSFRPYGWTIAVVVICSLIFQLIPETLAGKRTPVELLVPFAVIVVSILVALGFGKPKESER